MNLPSYVVAAVIAMAVAPALSADPPSGYWVEGCLFEDCTASGVSAVNVFGLVVTNNVFLRCGGRVAAQDSCMVRLRTCDDAKVVYNTAYGGRFTNDVFNVSKSSSNIEAHHNGFKPESQYGQTSGYAAWVAANGMEGDPGEMTNGMENGIWYAFGDV